MASEAVTSEMFSNKFLGNLMLLTESVDSFHRLEMQLQEATSLASVRLERMYWRMASGRESMLAEAFHRTVGGQNDKKLINSYPQKNSNS